MAVCRSPFALLLSGLRPARRRELIRCDVFEAGDPGRAATGTSVGYGLTLPAKGKNEGDGRGRWDGFAGWIIS